MSQFEVDWLAARRPHDHASRAAVPRAFLQFLERRDKPLKIFDFGAGTGSNFAFLAPRIRGAQHWTLVDQDATHKSQIEILDQEDVSSNWRTADLSSELEFVISDEPGLITASAFLDLVSADWIEQLVAHGTDVGAGFLFALTYDGMHGICPPLPLDAEITTLFNMHQRADKGFGPALGPTATALLREKLQDVGYHVETVGTPWRLGVEDAEFIDVLLSGVTGSAKELAPGRLISDIDEWLILRREQAYAGYLSLTVGHQDLFAWPENSQSNSVSPPRE